ncbi:enolase C-terminal domain-like protein [Paenibacillus sp. BK720]|uniref:enolase C-terminal domain-like protein n=1 Tax=Paenibacillus sp. BK720 TaxID=2587092 RepID=UPI00141F5DD5|nr:enolase C-terminal domain-like protein [Paenibacillus sp. BK720]NIK69370.1 L-alanine-DL-glutamate epimerase-like enolase superfamily enzyme [Paenibacillus sp. BK720]
MDLSLIQPEWKVEKIEVATLTGERARNAGSNGRLGNHGKHCSVRIARLTIDGETGFGHTGSLTEELADAVIGMRLIDLFDANGRVLKPYRIPLEYPILDWLGRRLSTPVYELISAVNRAPGSPLIVPCYDTSLYFDDLHLPSEQDAVALLKEEAMQGFSKGHRNFKIKVGRGGRHMPVQEGTKRDIAIIHGVAEVAGPEGKIMIDANNAYNLNLTKEVLAAVDDVNLHWMEEAFHEDDALYADLKAWLQERGRNVLIADGEGLASPHLVSWAKKGLVDVLQYDIIYPGFTHWLELGAELDRAGLRSAPHCYGNAYGIYALGHIAAAINNFEFVEYDDITIEGMDASAYRVEDGKFYVPDKAGFGLEFDGELFARQALANGWSR